MKGEMNPQRKTLKTDYTGLSGFCVICRTSPKRSKTAKTCDQHCAGKLAWETRLK
mgnify:CR=1 FL=1